MYVWLANFVDESQRIRPHVTLKLANVIGRRLAAVRGLV
jgi:hypothetical protein